MPSQNRYSLVVAWDLRDGSSCTPKNAADNRLLQMYVPLHYHSISVSEDYKLGQPTLTCLPSLGCSARTVQAGYAICDWHKHKVAWCPSCEKHKYSARWTSILRVFHEAHLQHAGMECYAEVSPAGTFAVQEGSSRREFLGSCALGCMENQVQTHTP